MPLDTVLARLPGPLHAAVVLAAAAVVGLLVHLAIYGTLGVIGRRAPRVLLTDGSFLQHTRAPARLLLPLVAAHTALPLVDTLVSRSARAVIEDVLHVLLVAAVAWLLLALTRVLDDVVARRFDVGVADNLRARQVRTQIGVLRRVIAIVVLAAGAVLMRFDEFRAVGTGLLASAGVVGIVVSIAAQRPLGNIVAGVQLALSQPIRVGDAVVVENEWGTVEEITLTYVVVRIWDQRRLVLPISHFFEHPFQNWTRTSAQVIGTVFFYVDYATDVAAVRAEFERVVRTSKFWDGQACQLQVSDASERTLQLRGIASAENAGRAWDLRCDVRERVVDWLRREHPEALPRVRVEPAAELAAAPDTRGTDGRAVATG